MRLAIIGAMEEETEYLVSLLDECKETKIYDYTFYQGKLYNNDVVLSTSGIGKVAASMLLTVLIENFEIDRIVNVGVAGGMPGKVKVMDIVIGNQTIYHDVDVRAFNYAYGQLPSNPRVFDGDKDLIKLVDGKKGTIITGDEFVTDSNKIIEKVKKYFNEDNVLAFDMESAAYAQTAHKLKKPFLAIRAISDVSGAEEQVEMYENALEEASLLVCKVLIELLKKI